MQPVSHRYRPGHERNLMFRPAMVEAKKGARAENRRVDLVVLPRAKINFAAPESTDSSRPWRKVTDGQ